MDSLSQIALGAAVGVATMGRRTAVWKAALWGRVLPRPALDLAAHVGRSLAATDQILRKACAAGQIMTPGGKQQAAHADRRQPGLRMASHALQVLLRLPLYRLPATP